MSRILILCFYATIGNASPQSSQNYRIDFTVNDPESYKVYYKGHEDITLTPDTIEKKAYYYDLKNQPVQTEFVTFTKKDFVVKTYDYNNIPTGEMSRIRTKNKKINITYRPPGGLLKTGTMTWEENMYHGKSFHQLILKHWDQLSRGQDFEFKLLLPYRFESLDFAIVKKSVKIVGKKSLITFALQPQSFIIRQFAPDLEAEYTNEKDPKIKSFYGPTTLPINGETGQMVRILFSY